MIDLTVIIITIWSLVLGIRRGLVVQLCHLAGLYIAIVAASRYAPTVGGIFLDDPGKAALIERIDSRHGMHTLDYAERLGMGSQRYELVEL